MVAKTYKYCAYLISKMKLTCLLGILVLLLIITLPVSEAMIQVPGKPVGGVATKTIPFKYLDKKINPGDTYEIYLTNINNNVTTMRINQFMAAQNRWQSTNWVAKIGNGRALGCNNMGCVTFTLLRIYSAHCLPRTNKCSEDAVMLSVN